MHGAVPELDPEVDADPLPPLVPELLAAPLLDPEPELPPDPPPVPLLDAPEPPELVVSPPDPPLVVPPEPFDPLDDPEPLELAPELAAPAYEPPLDSPDRSGSVVGPPDAPPHAAENVAIDRSQRARAQRPSVDRRLMSRRTVPMRRRSATTRPDSFRSTPVNPSRRAPSGLRNSCLGTGESIGRAGSAAPLTRSHVA